MFVKFLTTHVFFFLWIYLSIVFVKILCYTTVTTIINLFLRISISQSDHTRRTTVERNENHSNSKIRIIKIRKYEEKHSSVQFFCFFTLAIFEKQRQNLNSMSSECITQERINVCIIRFVPFYLTMVVITTNIIDIIDYIV